MSKGHILVTFKRKAAPLNSAPACHCPSVMGTQGALLQAARPPGKAFPGDAAAL